LPEKPLKVAYLLGSVDRGGAETLLLDCFNNSDEAGFDFIGIHRKGGNLLGKFLETGVPFYRVSFRYKFDIGYFFRLRKLLFKQAVTIVHAQQPIDALFALIATKGTGIRVVLTMHGYDFTAGKFSECINRFLLRRTALNLFVSNSQKEYYVRKYRLNDPYRLKVVYNGISFEKLENCSKDSVRNEFGIQSNALLLCSIGNFVPVRDQLTICRFLVLLKERTSDFRFLFAGATDPKNQHLYEDCVELCRRQGLTDNIIFAGSRFDVPDILAQSDAFLYASDHDTFGIAVIEAIASGLPVFVNDWEVMNEITQNGKYATVYKTKNEYHLLELFLQFLEDREPFQKKAKDAGYYIRDNFSIIKHMNDLNEAYRGLF
jgi:glycosyltransferase involved in cell wall biosynthesis